MFKKIRIYIIIFIVALIQYGNTFEHDYAWDDAIVITQNDRVQKGLSSPSEFFRNIKSDEIQHRYGYRPITLLTFAADIEMSEMTPKTGHVMNVLYYALLCCLIFYFLKLMFPEKGTLFSIIIVGLFLIHPVHTEVVANIKSRDEILAMIFGISSLIFFLNFLEKSKNNLIYGLLTLVMIIFSFLSKENGITFVGVLMLIAYFKNSEQIKSYYKYGLLIFGGVVLLAIRYYVYSESFFENNVTELLESFQYKEDGFIGNPLHGASSFMQILPNVFNILIKDIGLMIFPITLVHDYGFSHSTIVGWSDLLVIISVLFHLGLLYIVVREFRKKSVLLFGILFYFITLSVYLHVVQVGPDYMGERFLFIPSLGFIIAIVAMIERVTKSSFNQKASSILKNKNAQIAMGIIGVFFIMGFAKTVDRSKAWENNKVLFESDIEALDDCARTQYNFASLLHNEYYKRPTKSKQQKILYHYKRSVEIYDRSMKAMLDLGNAYMEFGQLEKGKAVFEEAVKVHKGMAAPLMQLGKYYFSQNQYYEALHQYEKAEKRSKIPEVYQSKAVCYLKLNQIENAISSMEAGEKLNPNYSEYFVLMSDMYLAQGNVKEAKRTIQKALVLAPDDNSIKLKYNSIK
ncbi:MAG: hypothetical protein COA33_008265 [Fluviicola sp.]|nr:hypothetical protein [Fluviicola sp.]